MREYASTELGAYRNQAKGYLLNFVPLTIVLVMIAVVVSKEPGMHTAALNLPWLIALGYAFRTGHLLGRSIRAKKTLCKKETNPAFKDTCKKDLRIMKRIWLNNYAFLSVIFSLAYATLLYAATLLPKGL